MSIQSVTHKKMNYRKVYQCLIVLLVISIWGPVYALELENRTLSVLVVLLTAFGIATVKTFMVSAWFMHLKTEKTFVSRLLLVCIAFMILLFAGVAPDILLPEGVNRELDQNYSYPKEEPQNIK